MTRRVLLAEKKAVAVDRIGSRCFGVFPRESLPKRINPDVDEPFLGISRFIIIINYYYYNITTLTLYSNHYILKLALFRLSSMFLPLYALWICNTNTTFKGPVHNFPRW